MPKSSTYTAKQPDARGFIHYSDEEHRTWHDLYKRQVPMLEGRVCREYIEALDALDLPRDRVPQLHEVSRRLQEATGWSVAAVPALIPFTRFFELLANRQFPAATFIRRRDDLDYLEEPDIFHEIFGHTPLLTDYRFAAFTEAYGRAGLAADRKDHAMLARLFWFTVEFGLLQTSEGLRSYGAGIVSSPGELDYALSSPVPDRRPFEALDALRTPYRIDIVQPLYFVIDSFDQLAASLDDDIPGLIQQAKALGDLPPLFEPKEPS